MVWNVAGKSGLGLSMTIKCRMAVGGVLLLWGCCNTFAETVTTADFDVRHAYSRHPAAWPAPELSAGIPLVELAALPQYVQPDDVTAKLIALGQQLFHEVQLSENSTVSCASCHEARFVFSDARKKALGVHGREGLRNTPPLFNLDLWQSFFWDGRAVTLEQQALIPIADHAEMNLPIAEALTRLNQSRHYRQAFAEVFAKQPVDAWQLASALAAFQRTLVAPRTQFDQFLEQAYTLAASQVEPGITADWTEQQLLGLHLFRTKARCLNCHNGPLLSDNQFHVTGFHFFGRVLEDLGRYRFTADPADSGKFRTPSLRAVSKTGPWMHNGNMINLRGVMNFYNVGGPQPKKPETHAYLHLWPQHSPLLKPLELSRGEIDAVIAFMTVL